MTDLVTLAEAKAFCRINSDDENDLLETLIGAASDAVTEYADNWDGEGEVPDRLKLACLVRIAAAYDHRDEITNPKGERGLLQPLRDLEV